MIDFHSHILPNIDDGSRSVEETFHIIKEAEQAGFNTIIATSHYIEGYYESIVDERLELITAINEKLKSENCDVRIKIGNEIYFSDNVKLLLEQRRATTIDNSQYILFELPFDIKPMNIYDFVYELLQNKLKPVLAHPERYSYTQKDPSIITDLIEKGVLMQINYGSVIGQYGEKAKIIARKLLETNSVHFLGSDVHRENSIYPQIPKILEEIRTIIGEEKLEEISTKNAELVLRNDEIEVDNPDKIELSFKEKLKINKKSKTSIV